jgi:hypothetical protein
MVSVSETSVMPTATMSSGPVSLSFVQAKAGVGS